MEETTGPLYLQIQNYIIGRIQSGNWPSEYQIPPERILAEQFKVSRITAKNAVMGLVNEGYLYRRRGKGTFVLTGKTAKKQETADRTNRPKRLIGFIIPTMEFHYSSMLFAGVDFELSELGYHAVFIRIANNETESSAVEKLLEIPVDGLIIVASRGEHFSDDIVRLALEKYPMVMVEKTMRDIKTYGVYCDTEKAGALMADFLVNTGIKDIGLVTYPEHFTFGVRERIFGFQTSLVKHEIQPLSDQLILTVPPDIIQKSHGFNPEAVPSQIIQYVEENKHLKGIATVDALLAEYVGMACKKLGLYGMKIVCCDMPVIHSPAILPVAYIDQSPYEMGRIAARMVVESIQPGSEPRKEAIVPKLVTITGTI